MAVNVMAGTCGTAGTDAVLRIYTGAQPSTADGGTAGTLLATINNIGWGTDAYATTNGTAALATATYFAGTCTVSGTAGWARLQTVKTDPYTGSAGTYRIDGDVGTSAACVFVINSPVMTSGGLVSLLTAPILMS